MKKTIWLLLALAMTVCLAGSVSATEAAQDKPRLSEMSIEECAEFLNEYGVEIPGGSDNLDYWENFILKAIGIVENDLDSIFYYGYSWTISHDFGEEIAAAVRAYYGQETVASVASTGSAYTLQDSTVYGSWSETYLGYNCYAYAIGRTDNAYNPGYFSGKPWSITLSITTLADYVKQDLQSLGYECVRVINAQPAASTLSSEEKVICVRRGEKDYHFMKLSGSSWYHKPGRTNPLRYNYTASTSRVWSNECFARGVTYPPTTTYTSDIKYIVYSTDHNYIQEFTGNEYHSGKLHYYEFTQICSKCLQSTGTRYWISEVCSGPPCVLQYTSVPGFTEME